MKKSLIASIVLSILVSIMYIGCASALNIDTVKPPTDILPDINQTPGEGIAQIIQFFILLTGILAVMAITWGGIGFITSVGEDEKMKKSRKTVIYAFVGLVIAGLAYSIVEIITKANITL